MTDLRLGKRDARAIHGLACADAYVAGRPPTPPPSVAVPSVADWGMLGNNAVGDCTIAGADHLIMGMNAKLQRSDTVGDTSQVLAQYYAITGGADTGCVEADVLQRWRSQGLFAFGNRIVAYAPVAPGDILAVHRTVAFYGTAYIGVQLPSSAMDQFGRGQPWSVVPGSAIEGGHCIVAVGYGPEYIWCVTWGQVVPVTWAWWHTYCDECWAVVSQEADESGRGPGGLDLAALVDDLNRLGG